MKAYLRLFFLAALSLPLGAQSNEIIDSFLNRPWADVPTTAYLVLYAAGDIAEDTSPAQALSRALERRLIEGDPRQALTAGDFSQLLFKSLGLGGGVLFNFIGGPWYAVRELNHRRYLPGVKFAQERVTPFEVVQALSRALEDRK